MNDQQDRNSEVTMDPNNLYREESMTDRRVGSIRILYPIDSAGNDDNNRAVLYVGQAQMMTPMGAVPLSFEIEAESIAEAVAGFAEAANRAVENTAKELQELRREQASSIVVPEGGNAPQGGSHGGGIQLK